MQICPYDPCVGHFGLALQVSKVLATGGEGGEPMWSADVWTKGWQHVIERQMTLLGS